MHSPPTDSSGGPNDLVVEIIETLETCGLEDDAYQLHDYVDVDALEQLVSLIRWGHHRPVYRRRNSARGLTGRCRRHRRGRVRVRRRITTFVAETGECSRKPSTARRPATARDCVSLALVRFAHENAAAHISCLRCFAGSGDGRGGLALLSPPGYRLCHRASSPVERWFSPARPLAAAARRVARDRPFRSTLFTGPPRRSCNQVC